jgi:alpha-tubulin suppressor-like RCC1 family protein
MILRLLRGCQGESRGNDKGNLGDGTTNERKTPVMIVDANVTAVDCGWNFSLSLKNDGSLWAMGANLFGQLGAGTFEDRHSPVQIVASGVAKVATGNDHIVFIKTDGSAWTAGRN